LSGCQVNLLFYQQIAAWTNSGPYVELFSTALICPDSLYSEEI